MSNKIKKNLVLGATTLNRYIQENPNFVNDAKSFWLENKKLDNQLKAIESHNKNEINRITKKYELAKDALQFIFGQRQTALNRHYETLDIGLKTDDREMIMTSLRGISTMISQNPLESFAEFCEVWDNKDETLYLDF